MTSSVKPGINKSKSKKKETRKGISVSMWAGRTTGYQWVISGCDTCSQSTRASLIDSMEKGKADCWQDCPGGKCHYAGAKARGGGTWRLSSPATGAHGWVTSKMGSVSSRGVIKDKGDQQRSDPSTRKCHLASPSLHVCVTESTRKTERRRETACLFDRAQREQGITLSRKCMFLC